MNTTASDTKKPEQSAGALAAAQLWLPHWELQLGDVTTCRMNKPVLSWIDSRCSDVLESWDDYGRVVTL